MHDSVLVAAANITSICLKKIENEGNEIDVEVKNNNERKHTRKKKQEKMETKLN